MQFRGSWRATDHHCWPLCSSGDTTVLLFCEILTWLFVPVRNTTIFQECGCLERQFFTACVTSQSPHPIPSVASHGSKKVGNFLHTRSSTVWAYCCWILLKIQGAEAGKNTNFDNYTMVTWQTVASADTPLWEYGVSPGKKSYSADPKVYALKWVGDSVPQKCATLKYVGIVPGRITVETS